MYFAPISQATKYNYLDDKFQAAYKWLAETDLDNTPAGSYPICEGVTANVQEYTTFPASEGSFETHDKFFDIQYVISGKEQFGVCKREGLVLKEDHPRERPEVLRGARYERHRPAAARRYDRCCPRGCSQAPLRSWRAGVRP